MQTDLSDSYRTWEGRPLVELKAQNIRQLFSPLDPSPFRQKDLADEVEEYIRDGVRDLGARKTPEIRFYLPEEEAKTYAKPLEEACRNHFSYLERLARRELEEKMAQGRNALLLGGGVLFTAVALAESAAGLWDHTLAAIAREGLYIGGWVAMWEPIQIFLYDWWPIRKRLRLYRKIAALPVAVLPYPEGEAK